MNKNKPRFKSNTSMFILNNWLKEGQTITIYNIMGGKVTGFLSSVDIYEIVLLDLETKEQIICFKAGIFYIQKAKGGCCK